MHEGAGSGFPTEEGPVGKGAELASIVESLSHTPPGLMRSAEETHEPVPSRDGVVHLVEALRAVLFPGYFGTAEARPATLRYHLGYTLDRVQRNLRLQVRRGLAFSCQEPYDPKRCDERAQEVTHTFLARLPEVQRLLGLDVEAAFQGDPAAPSPAEIIFCYPGLLAITNYRIAHELQRLGVPLLPRMIAEHAHSITGIDIHPGATIGERFFIDHGTGVVIGETAVIGERVRLYQGVTLGAKSFPADEKGHLVKGIPRHPIIEDDVIIYAGATVLGRITVGRGTVVGGNVWLTRSVPPGSRVAMQAPRDSSFESGDGI